MGKRTSRGHPPGPETRKRQKITHEAPSSEEVHSSRQLRQLLTFDQDLPKARHGLQSFKVLLDGLITSDADKRDPAQLEILRQLILSPSIRGNGDRAEDDGEHVYLPEIMQTWAFASQVRNDDILSAVPVVLALLLRVLSQEPGLWPQALGICRTLLHTPRLELLARNLSADKGKSFVISPTLRLVREAVCFDGGALARAFFRARRHTLHSLPRNMRIKHLGDGVEDPRKASARTSAVRLFLALLRFLHWEAKRELLFERDLISALTSSIKEDPPYLVLEIVDCLRDHVLLDKRLPVEAKGKLLNSTTLVRLSFMYSAPSQPTPTVEDGARSVEEVVHEFLVAACTSLDGGVLRPESGLYPQGINPSSTVVRVGERGLIKADGSEMSLDGIVWMEKFREAVPVHNLALSELLQNLRPWTSTKQSELAIAVFRAAPELVADYFLSKKAFAFDPKLSATWTGYAALLFSTVQLPLPQYFGNKAEYASVPPPVSIVLDNILPAPLHQKVLLRCLNFDSKLVRFFAMRLLVIALQKVEVARRMMREAAEVSGPLWSEAARRLTDEFCQRCPGLQSVAMAFRGFPEHDLLTRETASRLLQLYYHVIPQVALLAKFDVSLFVVCALQRLESEERDDSPQDRALLLVQLENLLAVARASPGMRWFVKLEELSLSPFTALLRVYITAPAGVALEPLEGVLSFVATEHEILLQPSVGFSLRHLTACLRTLRTVGEDGEINSAFWSFLDTCLHRSSVATVRYLTVIEEEYHSTSKTATGPLMMAILEQLPFLQSSAPAVASTVTTFVSIYVAAARQAGSKEDKSLLAAILAKSGAKPFATSVVMEDFENAGAIVTQKQTQSFDVGRSSNGPGPSRTRPDEEVLQNLAEGSSIVEPDNSDLLRWTSKSADEIVEEGFAASLITLLGSPHISIRKEAQTNLLKMAEKIKVSSYEEKDQIWLLLTELVESARAGGSIDREPVPGPIVAFARHSLEVLRNPLHCLYEKVNIFLTRGPVWSLHKLPLVHNILLEEPSRDDSYYACIAWLLGYLLESLRTPADVALFHDRRVYERIFSLASNGYMRWPLRLALLRIIYRTTCIESGSNTLITRFGVLGWLEAQRSQQRPTSPEAEVLRALQRRVWETCDRKRIDAWSKNGVRLVLGD